MVSSIIFSLQVTLMKGFVQPRWTQTSSVTEESRATGIHAGLWQRQRSLGDMTAQLRSATLVDLRNKGGGPKGLHRTYPRIEKNSFQNLLKRILLQFFFFKLDGRERLGGKKGRHNYIHLQSQQRQQPVRVFYNFRNVCALGLRRKNIKAHRTLPLVHSLEIKIEEVGFYFYFFDWRRKSITYTQTQEMKEYNENQVSLPPSNSDGHTVNREPS